MHIDLIFLKEGDQELSNGVSCIKIGQLLRKLQAKMYIAMQCRQCRKIKDSIQ